MIKVCDLMHKGVVSCVPQESLREVSKLMKANQFRSVVVAHESGEVWGLISIMQLIRFYGRDLEKVTAEEAMRPYRIEVDPQWPIERAVELMRRRKIEHLIIIDPHAGPKRPVGILTSFDIIRHMSNIETGRFDRMLRLA